MYSEDEFLPLSGLQHIAFCERQWALIHLHQVWIEDGRTADGRIAHNRVHDASATAAGEGVIQERAVPLRSSELGVFGVADLVEFHEIVNPYDGSNIAEGISITGRSGRYRVLPIEYKRGRPKQEVHADHYQLCAQAMCLEEAYSCHIPYAFMYYKETRHRQKIMLDMELREKTRSLAVRMHELFSTGQTPPATMKASVCHVCSLESLCMPEISRCPAASTYWQLVLHENGR